MQGTILIKGEKEYCHEFENGTKIYYRRLPLPIFTNLLKEYVTDERTQKPDWQRIFEEGAKYLIRRWENVFEEDGVTLAECNEENISYLYPFVLANIFLLAISHLPTNKDAAVKLANEYAKKGAQTEEAEADDPLAETIPESSPEVSE